VTDPNIAKLSRTGRVTIPKWLRDALSLKPGSWIRFDINSEGRVVLTPLARHQRP
jgi:AbrB family looped-hinge helix DNA binding protein